MARCPEYKDGTHRVISTGYDPSLFGYVNECKCGYRFLFPTNEMLERSEGFFSLQSLRRKAVARDFYDKFDPSRIAWCETHKAFVARSCAGPDCKLKETKVEAVEEGGE